MISFLAETFATEQGIDLSTDRLALQRLKEVAEKAKIELSTAQQTEINLPFITADATGPKHLQIKLLRTKLEALVKHLIARTITPCEQALSDVSIAAKDISEVILVGGQTRIPQVRATVEKVFAKTTPNNVNPDEAVALGAAIQADVLDGSVNDILLLDVTPLSLGLETLGSVMTKLVEKNATIPSRAASTFSTAENNQAGVTINVLQGDRELASGNRSLGQFELTDIAPAPRGEPQIEVIFDIDADGILSVSAQDTATGKQRSIVIKATSGLSNTEVEKMVKDAQENAENDRHIRLLIAARNEADGLIHAAEQSVAKLSERSPVETTAVDQAIADLLITIKGEELGAINAGIEALRLRADELTQSMYETSPSTAQQVPDPAVIEADFEDVLGR